MHEQNFSVVSPINTYTKALRYYTWTIVRTPPTLAGGVEVSEKWLSWGGWKNPKKAGGVPQAGGVALKLGGLTLLPHISN
jgi:hypothetical protein